MHDDRFSVTVDAAAQKATLAVTGGALSVEAGAHFDAALQRLTASGCLSMVIDLTGVDHLPSPLVAAVVRAHIRAASHGSRLTVHCGNVLTQVLRQVLGDSVNIIST